MAVKHSKAPWVSKGNQILSSDAEVVATVEREADVPVITVAPDMLLALTLAMPILESYHAEHSGIEAGRIWYVLQAARTAIAAATK